MPRAAAATREMDFRLLGECFKARLNKNEKNWLKFHKSLFVFNIFNKNIPITKTKSKPQHATNMLNMKYKQQRLICLCKRNWFKEKIFMKLNFIIKYVKLINLNIWFHNFSYIRLKRIFLRTVFLKVVYAIKFFGVFCESQKPLKHWWIANVNKRNHLTDYPVKFL